MRNIPHAVFLDYLTARISLRSAETTDDTGSGIPVNLKPNPAFHMQLRSRFAPTPSGLLHEGNAYSFILTWLINRSVRGNIFLRIDDLDAARKRPEFVEDIFVSLEWLGLDYDEGPTGPGSFEAEFSQRHRSGLYEAALDNLRQSGHCFACACTRASIRATTDGVHPSDCRSLGAHFDDADVTWRVATPTSPVTWSDVDDRHQAVLLDKTLRDFVVRRRGNAPSYQLGSFVDDCHFQINHIVRGEDLLESSAAQRTLATMLDKTEFLDAQFLHHPLLRDATGEKLAKSDGATSLKAIREVESTPEALYHRLSKHLGLPEVAHNAEAALAIWNSIPESKRWTGPSGHENPVRPAPPERAGDT